MPGNDARRPPRPETGWSSSHDTGRKRIHDFSNLLGKLVFAVEMGEKALIEFYVDRARAKYAEAVKR